MIGGEAKLEGMPAQSFGIQALSSTISKVSSTKVGVPVEQTARSSIEAGVVMSGVSTFRASLID